MADLRTLIREEFKTKSGKPVGSLVVGEIEEPYAKLFHMMPDWGRGWVKKLMGYDPDVVRIREEPWEATVRGEAPKLMDFIRGGGTLENIRRNIRPGAPGAEMFQQGATGELGPEESVMGLLSAGHLKPWEHKAYMAAQRQKLTDLMGKLEAGEAAAAKGLGAELPFANKMGWIGR